VIVYQTSIFKQKNTAYRQTTAGSAGIAFADSGILQFSVPGHSKAKYLSGKAGQHHATANYEHAQQQVEIPEWCEVCKIIIIGYHE